MRRFFRFFVIAVLLGVVPTSVCAEEKDYGVWERGAIKFGAIISNFDSDLGFRLGKRKGLKINGEDFLGLDETAVNYPVSAYFRFGRRLRNRVDFSYVQYHRESTNRASSNFIVENSEILANSRLKSEFDLDIYRLMYSYSFLQDERVSLGAGFGFYVVPIRYGIAVLGQTVQGPGFEDETVPLPAILLRINFHVTPDLLFISEMDAMYLEVGGFEGSLLDTRIALEYNAFDHFGFGLGFSSMAVEVSSTDEGDYLSVDIPGDVDFNMSGLTLYGKLYY